MLKLFLHFVLFMFIEASANNNHTLEVNKTTSLRLIKNEQHSKRNTFFPIKLPSLRLPCKRFSCRFGNCENLIINNALNYTCHCVRGVAGPGCDTLDRERLPCSSNPCYSGAKCFNYMDDYYCECPKGRTGKNCNTSTENALDPCKSNPCGSNGICYTATNGYWCFCNDGKHGFSCQNYQDQPILTPLCSKDSCLNDGKCLPMNNSIICACKQNYYGPRCEFTLNNSRKTEYCLTNVCQNNGVCTIKSGRVNCECDKMFTGKYCESALYSPCGKGSCHNVNGICIMDFCYCLKGFSGDKCDVFESKY